MTSKEALQALKVFIKNFTGDFEKEYTPMDLEKSFFKTKFETIQKDLEVLQVLKDKLPHITTLRVMEYEGFYMLYNGINCTGITKEEYVLLKEWLENGIRKDK